MCIFLHRMLTSCAQIGLRHDTFKFNGQYEAWIWDGVPECEWTPKPRKPLVCATSHYAVIGPDVYLFIVQSELGPKPQIDFHTCFHDFDINANDWLRAALLEPRVRGAASNFDIWLHEQVLVNQTGHTGG